MQKLYVLSCSALVLWACSLSVQADVSGGRAISEGERTFTIGATMGQITGLDGEVKETKRAYTQVPGQGTDYGHYLEDYNLKDMGFTDSYGTFGVSMEKNWKYVTLQIDGSYMNLTADSVASRVYAIGVEEVSYNGRDYEYMLIPEGQSFDADIQGGMINAKALVTPFHVTAGEDDRVSVSPWLHLGIFSVFGRYEIDAGPAQGVTTYEFHDHEYVIGGKGEGWAGMAIPEIGLGGELKLNMGKRFGSDVQLVLRGDYALCEYDGSTGDIGVSARHEKDIDLSYSAYELGLLFVLPLSSMSDLVVGLGLRHMEADVVIEAKERSEEEQEALREKYDKDVDFDMDSWYAKIGLRF